MAWSASAIFQQAMLNPITRAVNAATAPTSFVSLTAASEVFCALYGNTGTPDKTAAVGLTGYNAATSQWVTANEITGTGYTAGGVALTSTSWALDTGSSSIVYHAANPAWTSVTVSGVYGDLVYDNVTSGGTVAKQGYCYNYFGGTQSVTSGTFTIVWATVGATTGIFNITV